MPREARSRSRGEIDRSFEERERHDNGGSRGPGYYEEFQPDGALQRPVSAALDQGGGGVLAADSLRPGFQMLEMFERAGLPRLVHDYLGEPPAISAQKTTLRKAEPQVGGAWHQDGAFMGEVRALNLWLSLSRCGDEAPGLDIVPRRLDDLVAAGTEGTLLSYQVSSGERSRSGRRYGDRAADLRARRRALLRRALPAPDRVGPAMPKPRFAIESWFFGGSAFPGGYAPVAV